MFHMDIEGAFDNTSFEVIGRSLTDRNVEPVIVRWIEKMLRNRSVEAEMCGVKTRLWAAKGTPQGGILSPLLWCLVVDLLIRRLNEGGLHAQGHSNLPKCHRCKNGARTLCFPIEELLLFWQLRCPIEGQVGGKELLAATLTMVL